MILDNFFSYLSATLIVVSVFSIIANRIYPIFKWSLKYRLLFLLVSSFLALIPFWNISAAMMLLSLNQSYSVGLTILLLAIVINKFFKVSLFSQWDRFCFSIFNIFLGLLLYPASLGFVPYDIYYAGYNFWPLFFIISVLTIILVIAGSRLKWVFVAYILGWNLRLIPSPNFLDYLIDPLLFFISIGFVLTCIIRFSRKSGFINGGA